MNGDDRRTVLVTGATGGLGRELVTTLAARGWHVLAHGRDADRLAALAEGLGDAVTTYTADLSSLVETAALAQRVAADHPRLDVLVNNAAVGFGAPGEGREFSRDGVELRFAVDYLVPVLLGWRLTPALARARGRIVQIGSVGQAPLDLDDLPFDHDYHGILAYRRAKLALAAYTAATAPCFAIKGISVCCVHPASFMPTAMVLTSGNTPLSTVATGVNAVMQRIEDEDPSRTSGMFFDGDHASVAHPDALDPAFRVRLLETTGRVLAGLGVGHG